MIMTKQMNDLAIQIIDKVRGLLECSDAGACKIDKVEVSRMGIDLTHERVDIDLGNGTRLTLQLFNWDRKNEARIRPV